MNTYTPPPKRANNRSSNTTLTPYSIAWYNYKESGEYAQALRVMRAAGMVQPYIDNVLIRAFDAGRNSK